MESISLFSYPILNNPLWRIIGALGSVFVFYLFNRGFQLFLKRKARIKKNNTIFQSAVQAFQKASGLVFLSAGLKVGVYFLVLSKSLNSFAHTSTDLFFWVSLCYLFLNLVEVPVAWLLILTNCKHSVTGQMLIPSLRRFFQFCVIMIFGTNIMQTISDKPLSSIIAGLGIGGLAIAMAANATISNFFGSLVIFTDKPFDLGDFVKIDGQQGIVEEVGMRSTRIRTLSGSLLTVPNADLAVKSIENFTKITYFRRIFNIGLTYNTPLSKVYKAIEIVKTLLDNHECFNPQYPPLVYFDKMGDYSLDIYASVWYYSSDRRAFLQFCEQFQLDLLKSLQKANIQLAFPTQTIVLEK